MWIKTIANCVENWSVLLFQSMLLTSCLQHARIALSNILRYSNFGAVGSRAGAFEPFPIMPACSVDRIIFGPMFCIWFIWVNRRSSFFACSISSSKSMSIVTPNKLLYWNKAPSIISRKATARLYFRWAHNRFNSVQARSTATIRNSSSRRAKVQNRT